MSHSARRKFEALFNVRCLILFRAWCMRYVLLAVKRNTLTVQLGRAECLLRPSRAYQWGHSSFPKMLELNDSKDFASQLTPVNYRILYRCSTIGNTICVSTAPLMMLASSTGIIVVFSCNYTGTYNPTSPFKRSYFLNHSSKWI